MTGIAKVFDFETHEVRTVVIDGEANFVVADLAAALSLSNTSMASKAIDDDALSTAEVIDSKGRTQEAKVTNESGMYQLIFQSRKPEARRFRKWVTSEVLPALRRTGKYETPAQPQPLAIAAQTEIDRANIARAQIEMLGVAVSTGLLDKLWATAKTHVIAGRVIGEEPELPAELAPVYVPDFLKAKGLTAKDISSVQSWFGRRAVEMGEANGVDVPALRPTEQTNGTIRETRAWRREHLPLFEQVWDTYYAEKYARPLVLELGAA